MSNQEARRAANLPMARPTPQLPSAYLRTDGLERVPVLTGHDVRVDRRNESRHILFLRELQREAIEGAAVEARDAFIIAAGIDARGRTLTEKKLQLRRARMDSKILADDDLELAAKYAQLDDDYFHDLRLMCME